MSHEIFKNETKALHRKLDQSPLLKNIMAKHVTEKDYLHFLLFHESMNLALNDCFKESCEKLNFPFSDRLVYIQNDIEAFSLNRSIGTIVQNHTPTLNMSIEPCLGVVYVLEGARHGNKYIFQHLNKKLDLQLSESSYLNMQSPINWAEIVYMLDQLDVKRRQLNVLQAQNMFTYLIQLSDYLKQTLNEEYTV